LRKSEILARSTLLSILLLAAIGVVGWSTFRSWQSGPWDLPGPSKRGAVAVSSETPTVPVAKPPANTDVIVSKNLFDPERGASATRDAEENSRAAQRVRNMILVGTIIIGGNRTAIVQDGSNPLPGQGSPGQAGAPMRLKLGDNVDGFRLSEIADQRVVFTKDASRVELALDFFRKVQVAQPRVAAPGQVGMPGAVAPGQVGTPGPVSPQVIPNLPRRARIPVPPNPNQRPDS
jgi:hypothetical protein